MLLTLSDQYRLLKHTVCSTQVCNFLNNNWVQLYTYDEVLSTKSFALLYCVRVHQKWIKWSLHLASGVWGSIFKAIRKNEILSLNGICVFVSLGLAICLHGVLGSINHLCQDRLYVWKKPSWRSTLIVLEDLPICPRTMQVGLGWGGALVSISLGISSSMWSSV